MGLSKKLKTRFQEIYKNKRLLAIQLNGFTHKVFYDDGKPTSEIQRDIYGAYISPNEVADDATNNERVKKLLSDIPHYPYKHKALEILYVDINDR